MVCTLVNNDICHHCGCNFMDLQCNKFWPLWWWILLSIRVQTMLNHCPFVFLGQYWGQIKPFLGVWLRSWHLDASNVVWTIANWLIRLWQYCQLWWKTPDSLTASLQSEVQMGMCKFRGFTYFSHKQLPIEHKGGCAWKNWKV